MACELREKTIVPKMKAFARKANARSKPVTEETEADECLCQWRTTDAKGQELTITLGITPHGAGLTAKATATVGGATLYSDEETFAVASLDRKALSAWVESEIAVCAKSLGVTKNRQATGS